MRALCLIVLAAIAGLERQAPTAVGRLIVVIDGDAPAADPAGAARLRETVLQQVDPTGAAEYFEMTSTGLVTVAADMAGEFRRTVFTVTPPTYSGVSITYPESVEVLRGNEALRDAVIARRCPSDRDQCGGHVHAAAVAEARRAETTSARKLRALATQAATWRGARVLLVTSGWPTRDDARVELSRALRDLRDRGVSLIVAHVPSREPYRGLVRDASESLAAQLPARMVTLADEADAAAAAALVGIPETGSTPTAAGDAGVAVPVAAVPVASPAAAPNTDHEPSPGAPGAPVAEVAAGPPPDETLRKAADYVTRFERAFTAMVWHERYEQEVRVWRRFGSSGARTSSVGSRRTLESELFFAWLEQDRTWITVRDVTSVDGKVRPPSERRLTSLATRGNVSLLELRDLARENGRFNIGTIVRTFNEPTLALLFLDQRHRAGVTFSRGGQRRQDGRELVTYGFEETGRPTLIQSAGRDLPVRGTFEIDVATGEILTTTIDIAVVDPNRPLAWARSAAAGLTGRMTVDYRPHVSFDVLVPYEMRETYKAANVEEVAATATYSDFRRFQTSGRLILTP